MQVKMDSSHLDDLMTREDAMQRSQNVVKSMVEQNIKHYQTNIMLARNSIAQNTAAAASLLNMLVMVVGDDATDTSEQVLTLCQRNLECMDKLIGQMDIDLAILGKPDKVKQKLN